MTPRLLAACLLAVIASPFVLAAYALALAALFGVGVVLTAADLLLTAADLLTREGDGWDAPEWVR